MESRRPRQSNSLVLRVDAQPWPRLFRIMISIPTYFHVAAILIVHEENHKIGLGQSEKVTLFENHPE